MVPLIFQLVIVQLLWECIVQAIPLYYDISIGAVAARQVLEEYGLPVAIYDLNCTGSESRITECPHNALDVGNCNHVRDASVICQGIDGNKMV
jgi:hypothetical protein